MNYYRILLYENEMMSTADCKSPLFSASKSSLFTNKRNEFSSNFAEKYKQIAGKVMYESDHNMYNYYVI